MSHFIPGLSQLCKPLQALVKKNSEFVWTTVHDKSFQDLKDMVSEDCLIQTTLDKIHVCSKTDSAISLVMQYVLDGWPGNANECAEPAQPYFTYREELTIVDGLLVKSSRIVILTEMRHACLETLHTPHLGLQKTLLRAHSSVFWPGMTADIKAQISNCSACQKFQTKQPVQTFRNELPTTQPWTCLATDIFECGGKSYLIVVDRFSKFIVVCKVSDHSSEQTVAVLLQIFSEFGVSDSVHCDCGTNFTSQLFLSFCKGLDIKLSFSTIVETLLKELCASSKTL